MSADIQLPPGFRFHPTDEELVMHYLIRKCASQSIAVPIVAEIDLYKYNPWELPGLALYGEKEWYFFSPRDRKYPNGSRPNRAAGSGYWKATGADKPIGNPKPVGIKKALVFYAGKAPKGEKTNWIMHRPANGADFYPYPIRIRIFFKDMLDDWVLCRIYNKKGTIEKQQQMMESRKVVMMSHVAAPAEQEEEDKKPTPVVYSDFMYLDPSDSVPKLHTNSSSSEQVVSPEFSHTTCGEVESEPKLQLSDWEKTALDFQFNYVDAPTMDGNGNALLNSQYPTSNYQMSSLQDMFMFLQKPF